MTTDARIEARNRWIHGTQTQDSRWIAAPDWHAGCITDNGNTAHALAMHKFSSAPMCAREASDLRA